MDWTGMLGRLAPRGLGGGKGRKKPAGAPRNAWLTGPRWGAVWGVLCFVVVVKVNWFVGALMFCALARRYEDFAPDRRAAGTALVRRVEPMSCYDCYIETMTLLHDTPVGDHLNYDYVLVRRGGKSREEAAKIALWANRHDIHDAGLNIPCIDDQTS